MKVPAFLAPVCLSLFAFGFGCSGEDQPAGPPPSPKVVQTIKQPLQEPEKVPSAAREKVEQAKENEPAQAHDKPPVISTDDAVERPSGAVTQNPVVEKPRPTVKTAQASRERPGYYVVKKGDTLSKVAARHDTMQDPLKWPVLLRLNLDTLRDMSNGDDFAVRALPPEIELKYITPREAKEGLKKPSGSIWVVNVISASTEAEIAPSAVTLSRQGYPVYITRAYVKGQDYLRLRVGFFRSKKEASDQGEKIRSLLKFREFWATKVEEVEYEEVAGFLKTP